MRLITVARRLRNARYHPRDRIASERAHEQIGENELHHSIMMILLTLPRGTVLRRSLDSVEEGGEGEVGEDAFIACHSRLQEEEEEEEEVRKEGRKEGILRVKSMHTHAQDTHTHTHSDDENSQARRTFDEALLS